MPCWVNWLSPRMNVEDKLSRRKKEKANKYFPMLFLLYLILLRLCSHLGQEGEGWRAKLLKSERGIKILLLPAYFLLHKGIPYC